MLAFRYMYILSRQFGLPVKRGQRNEVHVHNGANEVLGVGRGTNGDLPDLLEQLILQSTSPEGGRDV
jgi:hypothetical protein